MNYDLLLTFLMLMERCTVLCEHKKTIFSILDTEWPLQKLATETWMGDENFDADGKQRKTLREIREELQERK